MDDCKHHGHEDNRFWFGFFLGGLIGAIILFFAGTREGKKAGKMIHEKGEDLIGDIQDRLEDLKKKGKEMADEGEAFKTDIVEQLEDKKGDLTKEVTAKIDSALEHIEKVQEQGRVATENIRKMFKNVPKKS
jgi:gas vesicle protein